MAWVDFSSSNRDEMDRLLDAFREAGTVDELGIGTIRDTFSDLLFPGTSTLHTRARYLLFTAWQVTKVAAQRHHLERAVTELRQEEVRLIEALIKGDPDGGVIGKVARSSLKRMPTVLYWSALGQYGIRRCAEGPQGHLRAVTAGTILPPDDEDDVVRVHRDPHFAQLPEPPTDLTESATFNLTNDEAVFLSERIQASCPDTYLAWLVRNRTPGDVKRPWDEELTVGLDDNVARVLAHGQRLSQLYEGAPLLYNFLLAEAAGRQDSIDTYEAALQSWSADPCLSLATAEWDRTDFWTTVLTKRRGLNAETRDFVDAWVKIVSSDPQGCWRTSEARELVQNREQRLKKSRSRFLNAEALGRWEGGVGVGALTYRWGNARTLVNDIRRGQGLDDA